MFLLCLGTSLATKEELAANGGYVLFPSNPTFESYNVVLSGGVVTRAAVVSVVITLVGTALSLLCTVALAYGLSRPGTVAGKPLLMIVLGTFLFTPGIIPNYLVIQELGMIDTYGALIAPIMLNAFNIVVVRAFFQGIPDELHEARGRQGPAGLSASGAVRGATGPRRAAGRKLEAAEGERRVPSRAPGHRVLGLRQVRPARIQPPLSHRPTAGHLGNASPFRDGLIKPSCLITASLLSDLSQ